MIFARDILRDEVAIVTGGGTGIGRAVAELMVSLGARVAIASRREEHWKPALDALRRGGHEVLGMTCDIREPQSVSAFVAEVLRALGRVDILVNNAGGQFLSPAEALEPKGWDAVIRNNLSGTFYMTREVAIRAMIPRKSGRIVNVIANIERGFPGMVHTGAARAGVENLTKTLAIEWAAYGITVNAIAPGVIRTDALAQYGHGVFEAGRKRTPLRRLGTPEEVAQAVVYIASPAASFITGETLYIDGGARLWGETWPIPDFSTPTPANAPD